MSYVDAICDTMRSQLDQAEKVLDGLELLAPTVVRELVNLYLKPWPLVPQFVEDRIAALVLKEVLAGIAYFRKYLPVLRDAVNSLGSPDHLRLAASTLSNDVSDASTAMAAAMDSGYLLGMRESNWSGPAAEGYALTFPGQPDAADRISEFSDKLHDALRSLADGIEQFYVELAIAVASFLGAVIGYALAIAEAAGVITIPVAVGQVVAASIALGVSVLAVGAMFLTLSQTVNNQIDTLNDDVPAWPTPPITP
jgi:hypothetical protein